MLIYFGLNVKILIKVFKLKYENENSKFIIFLKFYIKIREIKK